MALKDLKLTVYYNRIKYS